MNKKVHAPDLLRKKVKGEPIAVITAYDFTQATLVDEAGADVILVGDSVATVVQGKENTLSVTVDEMIYHASMVVRGTKRAMVVVDMPFMSYQLGAKEALMNAGRIIKESGAAAVKLEGGKTVAESVRAIVEAGIPVIGHVGLVPQSFHSLGGHRVQGKTPDKATLIMDDALAIENAGASAVVLEGIPSELGQAITEALNIPTIGIGAGADCSGQVLVYHDIVGLGAVGSMFKPKFVRAYADVQKTTLEALKSYVCEVRKKQFPTEEHSYTTEKRLGVRH